MPAMLLGRCSILGVFDQSVHTFVYDLGNKSVEVDGVAFPLSGTYTNTMDVRIGCQSSGYRRYNLELYSLRLWVNGTLAFDLQPNIEGGFDNLVDGSIIQNTYNSQGLTVPFTVNASRSNSFFGDVAMDSRFVAYGNGFTGACDIVRLDSDESAITLPIGLPSDEMYLVWPQNGVGYGLPVAVNQTEAWWIGMDEVVAGGAFSVYGRNLGKNCWVYIKELDQWLESDTCNPYKADFKMPEGVASGEYSIFAHNGSGEKYGWSRSLTLTVKVPVQWSGKIINVKDFGAAGDGITDDYTAVRAAYDSLNSGDTIYFPAGTYALSSSFPSKSMFKMVGDGVDVTIIKPHPSSVKDGMLFDGIFNDSIISDLTFDSTAGLTSHLLRFKGSRNVFDSIKMSSFNSAVVGVYSANPFELINNDHLIMRNCTFVNAGNPGNLSLGNCQQVLLDSCEFVGAKECSILTGAKGGQCISFVNCTARSYDDSEDGYFDGRWFVTSDYWGSVNRIYFGGCTSTDIAPPPVDGYHLNTGEQFLIEGGKFGERGLVQAATSNTVTIPSTDIIGASPKYIITIVDGTGRGQTRKIKAVDSQSNLLTLEDPWRVMPDTNSYFVVSAASYRFAIYGNHFDGRDVWASGSTHCASAGFELYGGGVDFVVDSNIFSDLRVGIMQYALAGQAVDDVKSLQSLFFNTYANNRIENCYRGISQVVDQGTSLPDGGILASTYRNNHIEDIGSNGLQYSATASKRLFMMSVFERNVFNNCHEYAVRGGEWEENQLFIANAGTNNNEGVAMAISYDHLPGLKDNVWEGYLSEYQKGPTTYLPPETLLELPRRVEYVGNSAVQSLPVWNMGVEELSWSATTETPWISLVKDSGVLSNQADSDAVQFVINEELLPDSGANTTVGTIVCSSKDGAQVKTATIYYIQAENVSDDRSITYDLSDFDGATVFLYDASGRMIKNYGEIEAAYELTVSGLIPGEWYRVSIQESDGNGNWTEVTHWWVGDKTSSAGGSPDQ